jgi:hypothetical protein
MLGVATEGQPAGAQYSTPGRILYRTLKICRCERRFSASARVEMAVRSPLNAWKYTKRRQSRQNGGEFAFQKSYQ